MTEPCAPPDLPGVLAEIARVAGRRAALRLALANGGTAIYMPRPDHICPDHRLCALIGATAARKIARRFQGEVVEIPMARLALVRHLAACGASNTYIAERLQISYKTVRRYRR